MASIGRTGQGLVFGAGGASNNGGTDAGSGGGKLSGIADSQATVTFAVNVHSA